MGFSSWTCAKTNLPILNSTSGRIKEQYEVVALFQNGDKITGTYDGYGRLDISGGAGRIEYIFPAVNEGSVKLVLNKFYKPEEDTFESVERNEHDPGQGHFHDPKKVAAWYAKGGFKTYKAYCNAYKK